ncbi:MAG: fibrillarin-like rRNA/tRNA 2'-O-methyltransferase [Thermoproteota archaeon]|nr:fibrillarin-like rRNA/tRNA 2'-O-methyltransferase [Thermoproteota archaeon]MDP9016477.1 fibrillarin-like rRNA/tRNA 2'-O-methyltransferase [Thermoproteota archaeon]
MTDNTNEKYLATQNLINGNSVYGEKIVKYEDIEYRLWDPFRSKLAGAILKGLRENPIKESSKVLYLGASTGTTVSHVSDIVGNNGIVFPVEPSVRVARELLENVSSKRNNIIPILSDARNYLKYYGYFGIVDVVYSDIAQPDQTMIAIDNSKSYLKDNGDLLIIIKTRSIDVLTDPKIVTQNEAKKLEDNNFTINQIINLEPFEKDHSIIHAKLKR